jgi:hypothetical protein
MKKLILVLAMAAFSLQSNASDLKIDYKESNFNLSINKAYNKGFHHVNLNITKDSDEKATLKVLDANGKEIYRESFGKKLTDFKVALNLSQADYGTYYVELTSGDRIVTKEISIDKNTLSY